MLVAGKETLYVNQFFVLQPGRRPTKHIYVGDTRVVSKTDPLSEAPYLSYYHTDHLGSTSYITDQNQNLVQHERAFPFGEPRHRRAARAQHLLLALT